MSEPKTVQEQAQGSSFWATAKAVAWSFLGIRRGKDFQDDIGRLKPYHLIAAGIIGVFIFIGLLMLAVKIAVSA
ncbi:membrane protein [Hylemonella gracilis str. Niagara R]|uniref:Membrane protein n=1 Tax=Hylemonella gracilis str. Niagara R TaxID=1458275 RepID=A0A016XN31_9BURK|nr:DUF2970 domain-containing protein [Hylemonella gracilis]EYC52583.1 membrane protein [Hylemonella gracilis str. Niagara R]